MSRRPFDHRMPRIIRDSHEPGVSFERDARIRVVCVVLTFWVVGTVCTNACEENVSLRLDSDYAYRVWLWFRYDSGNYEYSRSLEIIYLRNSLPKRTNNF